MVAVEGIFGRAPSLTPSRRPRLAHFCSPLASVSPKLPPKRPFRPQASPSPSPASEELPASFRLPSPPPNADLYLQAQEATLISNRDALAAQVEWREGGTDGTRLIRWRGSEQSGSGGEVWIDRYAEPLGAPQEGRKLTRHATRSYDALNLLDALPPHTPRSRSPSPALSVGFSDLPSDSEEMFYFDPTTREEIGREKKRRKLEDGREERLRLIREREEDERRADEVRFGLSVSSPLGVCYDMSNCAVAGEI